jgi:hypothetical protein
MDMPLWCWQEDSENFPYSREMDKKMSGLREPSKTVLREPSKTVKEYEPSKTRENQQKMRINTFFL